MERVKIRAGHKYIFGFAMEKGKEEEEEEVQKKK
jgi:hypothetical protein